MINTEYIIVGQGICGTFLSYYLDRYKVPYVVIDNCDPTSSSRVAAGVINPVTGRRIVRTWMIDQLLSFAKEAYGSVGDLLGRNLLIDCPVVNLFPSGQMRNAFIDRLQEERAFLHLSEDDHVFSSVFSYHFGHGEIRPAYVVQMQELLGLWRKNLQLRSLLIEEEFQLEDLRFRDSSIEFRDVVASKIIFCDGVGSANNPWFRNLPFALNKGEALIIRASGIPSAFVFKKSFTLVPLGNDLFWAGASHEWEYADNLPSEEFYQKTVRQLKLWLRVPFEVVGHVASVRPATLERRPFVGMHPHESRIGILNGMGTKGCSLAPYFASQLAGHLVEGAPILPEADVKRFTRILQPR